MPPPCLRFVLGLCLALHLLNVPSAQAYTLPPPCGLGSQNASSSLQEAQRLREEGNAPLAYRTLQQALLCERYGSGAARLYHELGFVHLALQEPSLAVASFQTALRLQPNVTVAQHLVEAWKTTGRLPQALQHLNAYLRYNPEDGDAWFMLGLQHAYQGNVEASYTAWRQHLALQPRSPYRGWLCSTTPLCPVPPAPWPCTQGSGPC
jgi:tetratricopeptide (TPR) repeat protein